MEIRDVARRTETLARFMMSTSLFFVLIWWWTSAALFLCGVTLWVVSRLLSDCTSLLQVALRE